MKQEFEREVLEQIWIFGGEAELQLCDMLIFLLGTYLFLTEERKGKLTC